MDFILFSVLFFLFGFYFISVRACGFPDAAIFPVIEVMKEEAAKRSAGRDAADDNDKRKWMSTAQLWVDTDADPVPVRFSSPLFLFLFPLDPL
jgi:hypothetical protein